MLREFPGRAIWPTLVVDAVSGERRGLLPRNKREDYNTMDENRILRPGIGLILPGFDIAGRVDGLAPEPIVATRTLIEGF